MNRLRIFCLCLIGVTAMGFSHAGAQGLGARNAPNVPVIQTPAAAKAEAHRVCARVVFQDKLFDDLRAQHCQATLYQIESLTDDPGGERLDRPATAAIVEGRFALPGRFRGTYGFILHFGTFMWEDPSVEYRVSDRLTLDNLNADQDLGEIVVPPAGPFSLRGRILNADGAPCSASVSLHFDGDGWRFFHARAGSDGIYRLQGLSARDYTLRVHVGAQRVIEERIHVGGSMERDWQIPRMRRATGRVGFAGDVAAEFRTAYLRVTVQLIKPEYRGATPKGPTSYATSDVKDGAFELLGRFHGAYRLGIEISKGGSSCYREREPLAIDTLSSDQNLGEFRIPAPGTFSLIGRFADSRGVPIQNLQVILTPEFKSEFSSFQSRTDTEGNYRIIGLRDGRYQLRVIGLPWYDNRDDSVSIRGDTHRDWTLARLPLLTGRLAFDAAMPQAVRDGFDRASLHSRPPADLVVRTGEIRDGQIAVRAALKGRYRLTLSCRPKGESSSLTYRVPKELEIDNSSGRYDLGDIAVPSPGNCALFGRLLGPDEEPVAGANVLITPLFEWAYRPDNIATSAEGGYRAAGLVPGWYNVQIFSDRFALRRNEKVRVDGETKRDWRFQVAHTARFHLAFDDAISTEVSKRFTQASLSFDRNQRLATLPEGMDSSSDCPVKDGQLEFWGHFKGPYFVTINCVLGERSRCIYWSRQTFQVDTRTTDQQLGTLHVKPPGEFTLSGNLLDADGNPVKDAWIEVVPSFNWNYSNFTTRTGAKGEYQISGLVAGSYTMSTRANLPDQQEPHGGTIVVAGDQTHDVRLVRRYPVRAEIVFDERIPEQIRAQFTRAVLTRFGPWIDPNKPDAPDTQAQSNLSENRAVFWGRLRGSYALQLSGTTPSGAAIVWRSENLPAIDNTTSEVNLSPFHIDAPGSFTLRGRVRDDGGRPEGGVFVQATPRTAQRYIQFAGRTGDNGKFSLEGLTSGSYTLEVSTNVPGSYSARQVRETVVVDGDTTRDVVLPKIYTVRATLVFDDRMSTDIRSLFTTGQLDQLWQDPAWLKEEPFPERIATLSLTTTSLSVNGRFRGLYTLRAQCGTGPDRSMSFLYPGTFELNNYRRDQNLGELHIPAPGTASLRGRVFDEAGRPLKGMSVYVWADFETLYYGFGTKSDSQGAYAVRNLAEGRYRVTVSHSSPPHRMHQDMITVTGEDSRDFFVRETPEVTVRLASNEVTLREGRTSFTAARLEATTWTTDLNARYCPEARSPMADTEIKEGKMSFRGFFVGDYVLTLSRQDPPRSTAITIPRIWKMDNRAGNVDLGEIRIPPLGYVRVEASFKGERTPGVSLCVFPEGNEALGGSVGGLFPKDSSAAVIGPIPAGRVCLKGRSTAHLFEPEEVWADVDPASTPTVRVAVTSLASLGGMLVSRHAPFRWPEIRQITLTGADEKRILRPPENPIATTRFTLWYFGDYIRYDQFLFARLKPGKYTLEIEAKGCKPYAQEFDLEVTPSAYRKILLEKE